MEEIGKRAFKGCTSLERIVIPPTVKAIVDEAFADCTRLTIVILNDVLEEIGVCAFYECSPLERIEIPPAVKAINNKTFFEYSGLTTVIFGDGLEEIRERAFQDCMSLVRIEIPPAVKAIEYKAFFACSGLATVHLNDGLENIGWQAFWGCDFERITIPLTVESIDDTAFDECSNLTHVQFCDAIEEFVSGESMRDWWDHGIHENCLSAYFFLVHCKIPERVGLALPRMWQSNIHEILRGVSSIAGFRDLYPHFDSINSNLSVYEKLKDSPALLELAIWKSKIIERTEGNVDLLAIDMKMQCRTDSLMKVTIIVPNVLSFLTDGDDGSDVVDGDEDGDSNGSDSDDPDNEGDEDDEEDDNGEGDGDEDEH